MTTTSAEQSATTRRVVVLAATAALGGFLFGYDSAVINGAVDAIQAQFDIGSGLIGFVVSSALLGAAAGAWTAGALADRFGRTRVMVVAASLFLVSGIGSGLAFDVADLIVWRVVGGFAIGVASVIAPAYIAEISPPALRGRLGSLQQMAIVLGIAISQIVNYLIVRAAGSASADWWLGLEAWRWMLLVEVIPALVYGLMALRIPESPRWLVAKGRIEEARAVLSSVNVGDVGDLLTSIRGSVDAEHKPVFSDLRGPRFGLLPVVWIGILLSCFQQFVGINVIFYYSSVLWQSVGIGEDQSLLISIISAFVNIAGTVLAISIIDRVGRRPLLLCGSVGMAVGLGTLTVIFGTAKVVNDSPQLSHTSGVVALLAANVFVFFFAFSWGPVVWVLLGEMFPNRIRAAALAVAASAQWIANFIVSTTFPTLSDQSLALAYGIYTAFAIGSFFFVLRIIKETKGTTLESVT